MDENALSWDDFITALIQGLDGIDYKTAKRIHKALYPDANVRIKRGTIIVTWPDYNEENHNG